MAEKKETKKKPVKKAMKFKITKANGRVIFRDRLDEGRIKILRWILKCLKPQSLRRRQKIREINNGK